MGIALPYQVVTGVRQESRYPTNGDIHSRLHELNFWLSRNIGRPQYDFAAYILPIDPDTDGLGVSCRTAEQATMVALRWA